MTRRLVFTTLAQLGTTAVLCASTAPVAVSPGRIGSSPSPASEEIVGSCPTFLWGQVDDTHQYEVVVFLEAEVDPAAGSRRTEEEDATTSRRPLRTRGQETSELEPRLVLRRLVVGSAAGWTPARDECLAPGAAYAWAVRALGATGEPFGPDDGWSAPARFRIAMAPSEAELEEALDALRRWKESTTIDPSTSTRVLPVTPRRSHAPDGGDSEPGHPGSAPRPPLAGTSTPSDLAALRAHRSETDVLTHGVVGTSSSTVAGSTGVSGEAAPEGIGVRGFGGTGVAGEGINGDGVAGTTASDLWAGVFANHDGSGTGLLAISGGGHAVVAYAPNGRGVDGSGAIGVWGESAAGSGVYGTSIAPVAPGVWGQHGAAGDGVWGTGNASTGKGVLGVGAVGVWGSASNGAGVYGTTGAAGSPGAWGQHTGSGDGVWGTGDSATGRGVLGVGGVGVWGSASNGTGVYGTTTTAAAAGVWGQHANSGDGVWGTGNAASGRGVLGVGAVGVEGESAANGGTGVRGVATAAGSSTYGVKGESASTGGTGVWGQALQGGVGTTGVYGQAAGTGTGVYGQGYVGVSGFSGLGGDGVRGVGLVGVAGDATAEFGGGAYYSGFFYDDVYISGDVSLTTGQTHLDHPLDPEHKSLLHAFIGSSERLQVYSGNVALDRAGAATVELPAWVESMVGDLRYQLTSVGAAAPDLHISRELSDGAFAIAGGQPGTKVSWQLTGVRRDPWAQAHPFAAEILKSGALDGVYYHPELYGLPADRGILALAGEGARDR